MKETPMRSLKSYLAVAMLVFLCCGCLPDYVAQAKTKAYEVLADSQLKGKTLRLAAAEWLDKEAYILGKVWEKIDITRAQVAPFCDRK